MKIPKIPNAFSRMNKSNKASIRTSFKPVMNPASKPMPGNVNNLIKTAKEILYV